VLSKVDLASDRGEGPARADSREQGRYSHDVAAAYKRPIALLLVAAFMALIQCSRTNAEFDPTTLPKPTQEPAGEDQPMLSEAEIARVVAAATSDRSVKTALANGHIAAVIVRAGMNGWPIGDRAGRIFFRFSTRVEPSDSPFKELCKIGRQTKKWDGVVARVVLQTGQVEASPMWTSGSNCVGYPDSR